MKKSVVKPAARSKKTTGKAKSVETKKASGQKTRIGQKPWKKDAAQMPGEEEISRKAYEIYQNRISRGETGTPADDWHKAVESFKKQ